ncbi:MAG: sigma-70 family RNA polymerase sigma factor [Tannerella sp.]|jgi:RNA polymerase sigma-70 factor (ECF subfamily)|nr:sigma-70 family RNA polymerase sigma factor [Tannerella sp.]
MTDYKAIILEVRRGDRRAQMVFYDLFAQTVFNSALAVVGNREEAEEIMQECILKALTKTALLNDDAVSMRRILNRMAVNLSIDALRKRKGFIISCESYEAIDCEDETEDAKYDFSVEDIRKAVDDLPDTYRSILALRLFAELSFDEIARQLGAKPATVRVQYMRGINKLRKELIIKNV